MFIDVDKMKWLCLNNLAFAVKMDPLRSQAFEDPFSSMRITSFFPDKD